MLAENSVQDLAASYRCVSAKTDQAESYSMFLVHLASIEEVKALAHEAEVSSCIARIVEKCATSATLP
jgi:hypothetical protein